MPFYINHILPLLLGTALTIGGMMPFWDAFGAIRAYGLNENFANSKPAQTSFVMSGARTTCLGLLIWIFYLQGKLREVDLIMSLTIYLGVVDFYVCWIEREEDRGWFRLFCTVVASGYGFLRLTSRRGLREPATPGGAG
jgi:hypothetical protein